MQRRRFVLLAVPMLVLTACAGTKVHDVVTAPSPATQQAPRTIAIVIEDTSPVPKHDDAAGHAADAQKAVAGLTEELTNQLTARGLVVVPAGQVADLQLRCQILAVRSGSEALRVIVGYGAGKAVLETTDSLSDLRTAPPIVLLSFGASSTTGSLPGPGLGLANAANGTAVALGAAGTAHGLTQGLPKEVNQTTDDIDEQIGKYFTGRQWRYGGATKP